MKRETILEIYGRLRAGKKDPLNKASREEFERLRAEILRRSQILRLRPQNPPPPASLADWVKAEP